MPDFAQHWAYELGAPAHAVVQLPGGINNFVFRCETAGCSFIVKGYPTSHPGQRDRMQAEVEFLQYANMVAKEYVPKVLHIDDTRRCVVLEHLHGFAYPDGVPPPQTDIDAACQFFSRLNSDRSLAKQYLHLTAADGYLRLTEHLQNIDQRLSTMSVHHLPLVHKQTAASLLEQLIARVEAVKQSSQRAIRSGQVSDAIEEKQLVVSASDFGFHNAISTPSGVRFIDFEFAGWDDPTKAVADFVLQPRVPVHSRTSPLLAVLPADSRTFVINRLAYLRPILRVKWVCIMLSVLQPTRLSNLLATQAGVNANGLVATRMASATKYFEEDCALGLH